MALRDWPDVLRNAGIEVKVHAEVGRLSHGALSDVNVLWHHDASPQGDSPGALDWMKRNFSNSSAQVWVDRKGVWHFISYGIAWHSGRVNNRMFDNYRSVGIETDHTVGENWPQTQIDSLRKGTAVVLKHEGKSSAALSFHKNAAIPIGRKVDPHGLDLGTERNNVQALINNAAAVVNDIATAVEDDFLMALSEYDQQLVRNTIVECVEILRDISNRLRVPNYPFDWLPAINNNLMALGQADGNGIEGDIDVDKLAQTLAASVSEEVGEALVEALRAQLSK